MFRPFDLTLVLFALAVAGCSYPVKRDAQVVASPDKVSLMLAQAADKASNALETLAAVEQARSPGIQVAPIADAPQELRRALTVSWVGPVEPITRKLAARASYNFLVIGDAPTVPLVVDIDSENMPVIDVLRDIGLQLGRRADLKVDASRHVVELHYAPVSGASSAEEG